LKILHVDSGREWRGGQQQVLYLTQGLEERGVVSVVATPQGSPLAQRLRRQNLPVIELPPSFPFSPRSIRTIQNLLADRNWNLVHAHTAHAHTQMFLAFRLPPPRPFHRPGLVVSRRVDFVPARDPLTRLKYTGTGQTFICVSDAIRGVLETYGVPGSSLRVVRSGVPLPGVSTPSDPLPSDDPLRRERERRDLRSELGVPADGVLIGSIAQLVEHKGHRYLLEALPSVVAAMPGAHLVLLGSGDQEKDLRRQAARLSLNGALTFAGFRPLARRYLPAMDLFVSASVEEGLGTSLLDAQAAGVAVVGTRAGGMPEAIEDGVTGMLVEPSDPKQLAAAIIEVLGDQDLRRRMGRAGRRWVAENFSTARMVEETLAVSREILGRA
jgi:glycosyltransferase involved in cell wall biosynthesis